MIINPFTNAFGLDISDLAIKAVQLARRYTGLNKWHYQIKFKSRFSLPPGLIVNGEIKKPEPVIAAIKEHLFNKSGPRLKSPWVVANLPETKTFIKVVTLPRPAAELTEEAIIGAAPSYLPFPVDEVYIDWQLLTPNQKANQTEVVLAAVPKKTADSYTYLLNIAGMTPLALEVEAVALARSLVNRDMAPTEAMGILDLGASRSSLVIYDRGSVQFSLSLPFSGEKLDAKIAAHYKITPQEAEKMKINFRKQTGADQKKIGQLLEENLEELAQKIKEAVQFYKTRFPAGHRLTSLTLCGGSAQLPGLDKTLSLKIKIKTRLADPTINLGGPAGSAKTVDPSFATAIGLARRAIDKPFKE